MEQSEFLKVGLEAVEKAKEVVMKYYQHDPEVEWKHDRSPVTIADKEAEDVIIETIKSTFPNHGFLGEETGKTEGSEYVWIIDPIDGTRNYMRGIPNFGILLGLMKGDEFIVGVACAPALGELLYAEKGGGAYCNGKKITVSSQQDIRKSFVAYGALRYFEKNNFIDGLKSLTQETSDDKGVGDVYMYHLLATGRAEISIDGFMNIWDVAPFIVIIREAGGKVSDLHGNPPTVDTHSFIGTNGMLHDKALAYFKKNDVKEEHVFKKDLDKPWGHEVFFAHDETCTVKLLSVNKGNTLSLQSHEKRREIWMCISGNANAIRGPVKGSIEEIKQHLTKTELRKGDVIEIPVGVVHTIEAIEDTEIIEVCYGGWKKDDITRYEDKYGRT